jgi:hypothetical protein
MSAVAHKKVICESDNWTPLTADQWSELHRVPEMTGARALASAMVAEAWLTATHVIRPLAPGRHSKFIRRHHRLECAAQQEARRWFHCNNVEPFTFLYLCHHLALDPGQIRRALAAALDRRPASPLARRSV